MRGAVEANGVRYRWPARPLAVVCIDGGDPAYLREGVRRGSIPNIARFMREGFATTAEATVPSFTCPNNMSIVTGTPASRHGISGNFYLDARTGRAVVMTGPELLRGDTILAAFAAAGARVAAITAKDKLRRQLGKGLDVTRGNVSFSSEKADRCTLAENGIEDVLDFVGMALPGMYSMELSLFVLEAGIRLLETRRPDLLYLSLTDWVQHKHAPEDPEARRFYEEIDRRFGRLEALGAVVALIADHGMSDKCDAAGRPNVIWLQDVLDAALGRGETRVILPITDEFVAHHGALGGFVRVWCLGRATPSDVLEVVRPLEGVESAYDRDGVCRRFDLPPDREGDVAVLSRADFCIGSSEPQHDLSGLAGRRLRSHGGVSEARVPLILSVGVEDEYRSRAAARAPKSHETFDYALNGARLA